MSEAARKELDLIIQAKECLETAIKLYECPNGNCNTVVQAIHWTDKARDICQLFDKNGCGFLDEKANARLSHLRVSRMSEAHTTRVETLAAPSPLDREAIRNAIIKYCVDQSPAAVQDSHGEQRIYCAGLLVDGLVDAIIKEGRRA